MEKTVTQRVYEHVAGAGRVVSTREVLAVLEDCTPSSVTFALSRLVREGNLVRVSHGKYRRREPTEQTADAAPTGPSGSWILDDPYLVAIFEKIRPVLEFSELAFLFEALTTAREFVDATRNQSKRTVLHDSLG